MKMPRRKQSGTGRYQDDNTIPDTGSYSDDPDSWDHDGSGGMTADEELMYSGDDADDEMYDEIGEADSYQDDDLGGSAPPRR